METSQRNLTEMMEMFGLPSELPLYTMYRGVREDGELRYDLTTMPHEVINGHYNKTKGHIHTTGHPELYTVLQGSAIFLLQKGDSEIEDVYAVKALKGQSVIIPGDYYHITINSGPATLRIGNWVSNKCRSDYSRIDRMKGMCYYLKANGKVLKDFVKNTSYSKVPAIRFVPPLKEMPEDLNFLKQ